MSKLSPKQDAFVKAYIAGPTKGNATKSAIAAGYSKKTAQQQGSRLLLNVDIQDALEKHRARMAKKFDITVEGQLKKHELIFQKATQGGQYSAANSAVKAQSELMGIEPPKKTDVNLTGGVVLNLPGEMSRDEWEQDD